MWRRVARGVVSVASLVLFLALPLQAQDTVGNIDFPPDGATVFGLVQIRGFAMDRASVSKAEIFLDGALLQQVDLTTPRIDLIEIYPDWEGIHTRTPGFLTAFQASRFSSGSHTIFLRVTNSDGMTVDFATRRIVINNSVNQSPLGAVDIPDGTSVFDVTGSFPVVGWTLDIDGIRRIDVQIDDLNHQSAVYGSSRPDVSNAFPDFPAALQSGFIANIDATRITEGIHNLVVRSTDNTGNSRVIGRRTVQIFNSTNNLRPFGFLDEPLRDAVLMGTQCGVTTPQIGCPVSPCVPGSPPLLPGRLTAVRGWALDLGTREDLGRVSYVELLVDGSRVLSSDNCRFNATAGVYSNCYGLPRFDVQRYYPTYPDSPRSGFLFLLDVGGLLNFGYRPGRHIMKLRVGDQEQTFADIPNTSGIPVSFQCVDDNSDFPSIGYIDLPPFFEYLKGTVTFNGWALDENAGGVRTVEIFVDGNLLGVATYGFARTDVQTAFPNVVNSINSGWRFTLDTNTLSDSRHRLSVRVTDTQGRQTVIGSADFYVDNPN